MHVISHNVKQCIELTLSTRSCSSVVAFRFFKFSPKSALLAFFSFFLLRSRRSLSLRRIAISSEADEDEDAPDVSSVPSSSWSVHEEEFEATDASKFDAFEICVLLLCYSLFLIDILIDFISRSLRCEHVTTLCNSMALRIRHPWRDWDVVCSRNGVIRSR